MGKSFNALKSPEPPAYIKDLDAFFLVAGIKSGFPWLFKLSSYFPSKSWQVFQQAQNKIRAVGPNNVAFVLASVVRAAGAVMIPLLIMVLAIWGIRIPIAAVLSHSGVDGVLWGFPAGSAASAVLSFIYYRFGRWRQAKMLEG